MGFAFFGVRGLGFWVWGCGCRVRGFRFGFLRFGVSRLGFGVFGVRGFGFRVPGVRFGVSGSGFRI